MIGVLTLVVLAVLIVGVPMVWDGSNAQFGLPAETRFGRIMEPVLALCAVSFVGLILWEIGAVLLQGVGLEL